MAIQNPKNLSEKISKNSPPETAKNMPVISRGFSSIFIRITAIKTKFKTNPLAEKETKKLVWSKHRIYNNNDKTKNFFIYFK